MQQPFPREKKIQCANILLCESMYLYMYTHVKVWKMTAKYLVFLISFSACLKFETNNWAYQSVFLVVWSLFCKKKTKKGKKKEKTERKGNLRRNGYYVAIRLQYGDVKSRCEETESWPSVCDCLYSQPLPQLCLYPLSQNQYQKLSLAQDINSY